MIETLALFAVLILLAMLVEPLAERFKLPFSSLLVLLGFIGSEIIVFFGFDTGLRWHHFVGIILHVLLPIIIFESAFNANTKALRENIGTILFLAIPAMLIAAGFTGWLIYLGIGNSTYFPLTSALLAGVVLSATDPVAVTVIFKKLGAPPRLTALLEGESLFNDATAIVVYSLLVAVASKTTAMVSIGGALGFFIMNFVGGAISGFLLAFIAKHIYVFCRSPFTHTLLGLITAIITFFVAEHILHVSGVVSVLCAGLLLGGHYRDLGSTDHKFSEHFWELSAYIANAILFILVGVTITVSMFTGQWLAMLIGIAAATLARILVVYGLFTGFTMLPAVKPLSMQSKSVMMWGGLRGAVSLALALALPTEIEGWYTIQSIVYGVVIFTLFVQAPLMDGLVRKILKN